VVNNLIRYFQLLLVVAVVDLLAKVKMQKRKEKMLIRLLKIVDEVVVEAMAEEFGWDLTNKKRVMMQV
jgi:hypothetical protein